MMEMLGNFPILSFFWGFNLNANERAKRKPQNREAPKRLPIEESKR